MPSRQQSRRTRQQPVHAPGPAPRRVHAFAPRATALILLALGVIPLANIVTNGIGLQWWGPAVKQWLTWGGPVCGLAALLGVVAADRIEALAARVRHIIMIPTGAQFSIAVALLGSTLALFSAWWLFGLEPIVGDEFAQRFHAMILEHGMLSARSPMPSEFFSTSETLTVGDRWFSQFPVGGPLVLALGGLVRMPWLVNPVLTGFAVLVIYAFVRGIHDEATARFAALLACTCVFIVFMGGSQMNHTPVLLLVWTALALLTRWSRESDSTTHSWRVALLIGASLGAAATIRPFDAFLSAILIGLFQLFWYSRRQHFWRDVAVEAAAALAPVVLLLIVNKLTLGAPLPFAYDVLNGPEHRPGFHMTPMGFEHTPRRALYMASAYVMKLDVELFAWPVPGILLIVLALLLLRESNRWIALLCAFVLSFVAGYAGYWAESYFLGPRFLFVIAPALVYLTVLLPSAIRERTSNARVRAASLVALPLFILAAWVTPVDGNMQFGIRRLAQLHHIRSSGTAVEAEVRRRRLTNALVLIPQTWKDRLTARLRAVGFRPLAAEQMLRIYDACTLQLALDEAERNHIAPAQVPQQILNAGDADLRTSAVEPAPTRALVSLNPARQLTPDCLTEFNQTPRVVVSLAEMLRYADLDAHGALAGDVVYARDFGERNALLLPGFGSRAWYIATTDFVSGAYRVSLTRYR